MSSGGSLEAPCLTGGSCSSEDDMSTACLEAHCFEVLGESDECMSGAASEVSPGTEDCFDPALFSDICSPGPRAQQQRPELDLAAMRLAEKEAGPLRPSPGSAFLHGIPAGDRASAVDAMTRVATLLQLPSEVLFLGVACLDCCLAQVQVSLPLLNVTALACLWVAAKYTHAMVPPAAHFLAAAQMNYASSRVRKLLCEVEARVLQVLNYQISSSPTTISFLHAYFAQQGEAKKGAHPSQGSQLYCCACYLAEMSLLECKLVPFPSSQVAAASYACAALLVGTGLSDEDLVSLTGYRLADIKQPLQWLLSVHHVLYQGRNLPLGCMYETARKYMQASMHRVGLVASISSTNDPRLLLC